MCRGMRNLWATWGRSGVQLSVVMVFLLLPFVPAFSQSDGSSANGNGEGSTAVEEAQGLLRALHADAAALNAPSAEGAASVPESVEVFQGRLDEAVRAVERAKAELDAELARVSAVTREGVLGALDRGIDQARRERARTLSATEFRYYDELAAFYEEYRSNVAAVPGGAGAALPPPTAAAPQAPAEQDPGELSAGEFAEFMRQKWLLAQNGRYYPGLAAVSLKRLAGLARERYPENGAGYYYAGLTTADPLISYQFAAEARSLQSGNRAYRRFAEEQQAVLAEAFFLAIREGDLPFVTRIWSSGISKDFRSTLNENAYEYAAARNSESLAALLAGTDPADRAGVAAQALPAAVESGNVASIRALESAGAELETELASRQERLNRDRRVQRRRRAVGVVQLAVGLPALAGGVYALIRAPEAYREYRAADTRLDAWSARVEVERLSVLLSYSIPLAGALATLPVTLGADRGLEEQERAITLLRDLVNGQ